MSEVVEPGLEAMDRQNRLVSEHLRRIFVQIYRIVDNVADAQDLTQETFIKALQHQEQLKDGQKAAHWLSRIATNTAIDFLRRNSRATFCDIDEAPESHTESPEQELLRGEHRANLKDGLWLLRPPAPQELLFPHSESFPPDIIAHISHFTTAITRSY